MKLKSKSRIGFVSYNKKQREKLATYKEQISYYKKCDINALELEYIDLKTEYEHKKRVLSLFVVTAVLSVVMDIWRNLFTITGFGLQYFASSTEDEQKLGAIIMILTIGLIIIVFVIFITLISLYLRSIRNIDKQIMILEEIINNRK